MLHKSSILLLVSAAAFAVEPAHEVYIVNRKPASIAIVNTSTWDIDASIKLPAKSGDVLWAPDRRFAYVLQNGLDNLLRPSKKPSELLIVDMVQRKIVKNVPLGLAVWGISLSPDGQSVIAASGSRLLVNWRSFVSMPSVNAADIMHRGRARGGATLTLVDRSSDHSATVLPLGSPSSGVLFTRDGSERFVLDMPGNVLKVRKALGENGFIKLRSGPRRAKSNLSIYRRGQGTPVRTVAVDCWPAYWWITPDGKWAYLLDPGVPSTNARRYQEGELVVVDTEAGKVAAVHKAGANPDLLSPDPPTGEITLLSRASAKKGETKAQLLRFLGKDALPSFDGDDGRYVTRVPGVPGRWLVTGTAMCAWPDGGSPGNCIPLNRKTSGGEDQKEDQKEAASEPSLNGVPDDLVSVLGGEALAVKAGDKLGIVDLKTNRLEHVITTGRGVIRVANAFETVMATAALVAMDAVMAREGVAGVPVVDEAIFDLVYTSRFGAATANHGMLAGPDGDTVYALNTSTNDVTILDARTGKPVAKIPVGGECAGIGLTPNGRFVVAHSPDQITLIDTRTRKRTLEYHLHVDSVEGPAQGETVTAVYMLRQPPRIVALASHSLVVINSENGEMAYTPQKFGEPIELLEPGQP
jgi:YVTN family beta-propeller protein